MATMACIKSPIAPATEPYKRKLSETTTPVENDSYFTHNPHPASPRAPTTIMAMRPRPQTRPSLHVRFDHLLALDVPHSDDRHPNDMYAHEKVTTPHPAQRILYRSCSTPPSRSSSWSELMGLTPGMGSSVRSPPMGSSGDESSSGGDASLANTPSIPNPGRRTHAPMSGIARLLREDATLCNSPTPSVDSPVLNTKARSHTHSQGQAPPHGNGNARGNSWVFDEAERQSFERARGGMPSSLGAGGYCFGSPINSTIGAMQMSRKRNGSERSLRSMLSLGSGNGSPTLEREGEGRVMRGVKRLNDGSGRDIDGALDGDADADTDGGSPANTHGLGLSTTDVITTAQATAQRHNTYAGYEQRMVVMRSQSGFT